MKWKLQLLIIGAGFILYTSSCSKTGSPEPASNVYSYIIPLTNLIYYSQDNSGCTDVTFRNEGCVPASCLMGAHLMNTSIVVTPATFDTFCVGMGTSASGTTIASAYNYLHANVFTSNFPVDVCANNVSGKATSILRIKTYLSSNHPVITGVRYSYKAISTTTIGTANHCILIVGLDEAGAGTIYYEDPDNNSGLKSVDLGTFCTSMIIASANSSYHFLRIGN